jgi:hypothetical protein
VLNQVEYYQDPGVRSRIAEYCGATVEHPDEFSAEYLVGYGEALLWEGQREAFVSVPKEGLPALFEKGLDIFRSNWDRTSTLGVIDIEYFNMDFAGETYLNPQRCFELLEPARRTIRHELLRFEIPFIEIMTGQGYHFTTRVVRNSAADAELIALGRVDESLAGKYAHATGRRHRYVSRSHGQSFDGMGRMMEYLSHRILREAGPQSPVPIVTTDVAVGKGKRGREALSIDLSMYGDPLYMRDVRVPFSSYQKHKVLRAKVGAEVANNIPVQTCFPTGELDIAHRLTMRRHFRMTAEWAASCGPMTIPAGNAGFLNLIDEYKRSRLYEFHRHFDSVEHDAWTSWPQTYDRFDLKTIPPCVAWCLQVPNPNLLKPTNLLALTRTLLTTGWHPKHIAGLVRSKFERNHGWESGWAKYDAATRADFYVRLFAGQIATGLDQMVDHNCVSHREKGYCLRPWCGYSLGEFR